MRRVDTESGGNESVVDSGIDNITQEDHLRVGNTWGSEADVRPSDELARKPYFGAPKVSKTIPSTSADSASYRGAFPRDDNVKFVESGAGSEHQLAHQGDERTFEQRPQEKREDSTTTRTPIEAEKPIKRSWIQRLLWKSPDEGPRRSASSSSKTPVKFTFASQIRATLFNSWINVLLIAAPVGIGLNFAKVSPVAVFVVNFIAIVPLAAMLSFATEEIALRTSETLGGLLNASFG